MIEGRVEMMRSRRRKQKRRVVALVVACVLTVAVVLVLWRPWETEENASGVETHDGEIATVNELPNGNEPPDEIVLPRHYSVEVWHTPADAEKLNDVEYQL
ncbi:MAG: hypothetical protein NTW26_00890, partial [bacterium]|nr:hypothetical protein [bacterium]